MARPGRAGVALAASLAMGLLMISGCDSLLENQEKARERRSLEDERTKLQERQRQLQESIARQSAGKSEFTAQERAVLGPQTVELNATADRLREINARLSQL